MISNTRQYRLKVQNGQPQVVDTDGAMRVLSYGPDLLTLTQQGRSDQTLAPGEEVVLTTRTQLSCIGRTRVRVVESNPIPAVGRAA